MHPRSPRQLVTHLSQKASITSLTYIPDVNFANHLRTDTAVSALSFVDVAKEVGKRWQDLSPQSKRRWESQAAQTGQEYEVQMDEYKKMDLYRKYQAYLENFERQQALPKHSKCVSEVPNETAFLRGKSRKSPCSSGGPVSLFSSNVLGRNMSQCSCSRLKRNRVSSMRSLKHWRSTLR